MTMKQTYTLHRSTPTVFFLPGLDYYISVGLCGRTGAVLWKGCGGYESPGL